MTLRKIKLTVQYDGSRYSGWQTQPGKRTIQSELVEAVSNLIGQRIPVHGASRTDAGVSALGQAALIEVDCPIPTENFPKAINAKLPHEIVVTSAEEVPKKFDLIGDVKSKLYRYTIHTGKYRPVLKLNQCWHLHQKLDVEAMNAAAQLLVGKKDFKSFATAADKRQSSVRTIFRCEVKSSCVVSNVSCETNKDDTQNTQYAIRNTQYDKNWINIDVEGDGFLYNMVRNIVGTLTEIGNGRWRSEKITEILEAKTRTAAGRLAPPEGLCLIWIKY